MLKNLKNLNKFKAMSVLTSVLYFYFFIALLLFPESFCKDFGMVWSESLDFFARRASAFMLCISSLLFLARNTPPSIVRQAIAFSVGLNMAGFALSSTTRLINDYASTSILFVIVIEILVAVIYFSFVVSDRRNLKKLARRNFLKINSRSLLDQKKSPHLTQIT